MFASRIAAIAFGALSLTAAAFSAAPASAAPIGVAPLAATHAAAPFHGGLVEQVQYYGPRRHYGRPVYRPRCFVTDRRVWTGHRWIIRPVRVCR